MPTLIVINGPLGSGKSTLARRYGEDHPLTLVLDIDDVWAMISHWREHNDVSTKYAKDLALTMAREHLSSGNDVVIPQIIQSVELAEKFERVAEGCRADYYEILLEVEKSESIERFIERNKKKGHPTGFREGGVIDTHGREKKLAEMYDRMTKTAKSRPHTRRVKSVCDDIEGTYSSLLSELKGTE